jgi:glycosyltransferase involved in cell wall biosynthesis
MVIDLAPPEMRPLTLARGRMPVPSLLHVLPSFAVGGVQVRLARVITALGQRYRHRIVALDGNRAAAQLIDDALDIEFESATDRHRSLPVALIAIRRRLAARPPDLLLTYNWGAIEWALANTLFAGGRHVHFEDGFGPEESERRLRRRSLLRRIALARSSCVVVPSRTLDTIARREWHLPAARVRHIANGIDAEAFAAPRADEPLFERTPDEVIIGTVAPLRPEKNVARLVRVFARLDPSLPIRLAIAGAGTQRADIEALARGLGLAGRIIFLGAVAEPQRALALFDIFALSSDTEQMPMSVLEAMAMGLPVVSVDVGDVSAMLAPENRDCVVAKADENAFAAALAQLADAPRRRADIGARNRAHVQRTYSWTAMVDEYDRIFSARQ